MSAMFASSAESERRRAADRLAAALATSGIPCRVEARSTLAVLIVDPSAMSRLADAETRRTALAIARQEGFTHLAVELAAGGDRDASLLRP